MRVNRHRRLPTNIVFGSKSRKESKRREGEEKERKVREKKENIEPLFR